MMNQLKHLAAIVPFALIATGCASSDRPSAHSTDAGDVLSTSQQQLLAGRAIPPQGQVEISVAYCGAQKEIQTRNQVVDLGRPAEYDLAPGIDYKLTASAVPTPGGAILMSVTAQWQEPFKTNMAGRSPTQAAYMNQFLVKDSEVSPPIALRLPQGESCFTITAAIRPTAATSPKAYKPAVQH
jgi:hypothetical protein